MKEQIFILKFKPIYFLGKPKKKIKKHEKKKNKINNRT